MEASEPLGITHIFGLLRHMDQVKPIIVFFTTVAPECISSMTATELMAGLSVVFATDFRFGT